MWPNMLPAAQLEGFKALMATRTKFIDDFIEKSVLGLDGSGVAQVVIVGSGLDSRAYRMFSTSSATVFELDLPEVFVLKNNILKKAEAKTVCGALKQVHADATVEGWDSKLIEAGFDSTKPSVRFLVNVEPQPGCYLVHPLLCCFVAAAPGVGIGGLHRLHDGTRAACLFGKAESTGLHWERHCVDICWAVWSAHRKYHVQGTAWWWWCRRRRRRVLLLLCPTHCVCLLLSSAFFP